MEPVLYGQQIRYHTYFVLSDLLLPDELSQAYDLSYHNGAGITPMEEQSLHTNHDNSKDSNHIINGRSPIHDPVRLDE